MIGVTAAAILCSYLTFRQQEKRRALKALEDLGARVWFEGEHEWPHGQMPQDPTLRGRLASQLDKAFLFHDVVTIDLRDTPVCDDDLLLLKALPAIRTLHLDRTQVTDAGILQLSDLRRLEFIGLEGTTVTEGAFKTLQREVPNLKTNRNFFFELFLNVVGSGDGEEEYIDLRLRVDP